MRIILISLSSRIWTLLARSAVLALPGIAMVRLMDGMRIVRVSTSVCAGYHCGDGMGACQASFTLDLAYTPGAYVALTYKAYTVLGANVLGDANMPCIQSVNPNENHSRQADER